MSQQKAKSNFSKEFLSQFKNLEEVEGYVASLKQAAIESMLEGELDRNGEPCSSRL